MIRLSLPRRVGGIVKIATLAGLGAIGVAALAGEYGHRQVTREKRSDFSDEPGRWELPDPERLTLRAKDSICISAMLFLRPQPAASVVVCHGHGGNKHTLLPYAQFLTPHFNVLLLDSRGHGESGGGRTTVGYEERLDVQAAVGELLRRGLGPVGVYGISMGAAVAVLAAADDDRIRAVVADSPFARLRWAVEGVARLQGYPRVVAPAMAYAACRVTALRCRYPMSAFDPLEAVAKIAPRPLLLIHGELDAMIGVRHSRSLFERAGEPKQLWVLEGLEHCKGLDGASGEYQDRIVGFLRDGLGAAAVAS